MSRSSLIRLAFAGVAGALAASAVIGVLVLVNAGTGFGQCTATTSLGWLVPLVAGTVIAGVAFVLMANPPVGSDTVSSPPQACCTDCGGTIRGDWRLCPHCGARLNG